MSRPSTRDDTYGGLFREFTLETSWYREGRPDCRSSSAWNSKHPIPSGDLLWLWIFFEELFIRVSRGPLPVLAEVQLHIGLEVYTEGHIWSTVRIACQIRILRHTTIPCLWGCNDRQKVCLVIYPTQTYAQTFYGAPLHLTEHLWAGQSEWAGVVSIKYYGNILHVIYTKIFLLKKYNLYVYCVGNWRLSWYNRENGVTPLCALFYTWARVMLYYIAASQDIMYCRPPGPPESQHFFKWKCSCSTTLFCFHSLSLSLSLPVSLSLSSSFYHALYLSSWWKAFSLSVCFWHFLVKKN